MEKKPVLILIAIVVFLIITLVIFGLLVDCIGFVGNLIAETIGILIGIVVTLYIVDRYVKWRKKLQWEKVSSTTYLGLAMSLGRIFAEALFSFEGEYGEEEIFLLNHVLIPGKQTIGSMENITTRMRNVEESVFSGDEEGIEERTAKFYKDLDKFHTKIQPIINRISITVIPRLLQYSENNKLIEELVDFEQITYFGFDTINQVFTVMNEGVTLDIQHRMYGTWVSTLLNISKDVFNELCNDWNPEQVIN